MPEPKEDIQVRPSDDEVLDEFEKSRQETPSESSSDKQTTVIEPEPDEDAGADQQEKASPKKGEEEKPQDPRDLAFRKGYSEAQTKFRPKLEELEKRVEEVNKIITSAPYIQASMKAQGFRDEVIDEELRKKGHVVPERKGDDLSLVTSKLNIDPSTLDDQAKLLLRDYASVTRIILDDWAAKNLPQHLRPLQEGLGSLTQAQAANQYFNDMKEVVTKEGILDFKKDIEPQLHKWMDENPEGTQKDLIDYFKDLNHELTLERFKTGGRKKTRDELKTQLRTNKEGGAPKEVKIGDKSLSDDELLDRLGYKE